MKLLKHLKTIHHHKMMVMKYCFTIGLYRQGLLHDLSKYSWTELRIGMKYYQGDRSPNNAEREIWGFSTAWLHHKGRNKHHYEYWIDYSTKPDKILVGMPMPMNYILEMFCDRVAASRTYRGVLYKNSDPLDYFLAGKDHYLMHPHTMAVIQRLLEVLALHGEEKALAYAKTLNRRDLTPVCLRKRMR